MKIAVGSLLLLATLVQCRFMTGFYRRAGSYHRTGATDLCSGFIGSDPRAYEECHIFVIDDATCEQLYSAMNSPSNARRAAAGHLLDLKHCEPPLSARASAVSKCGQSPALRQREPFMNKNRKYGRILGGEDATNCTVVPWQVFLHDNEGFCGGSIISERHILTAAHCFDRLALSSDPNILLAKIGVYDFHKRTQWGTDFPVIDVTIHESYEKRTYEHDIAIVTLKEPLEFNECVAPICLDSAFIPDGQGCIVSGWGRSGRFGNSEKLMMAKVEAFNGPKCEEQFQMRHMKDHVRIKESLLCAGYIEGGIDACTGDSGGPLACWHNDHYVLVGVVSYGKGCARRNEPGFYSKVAYYKDWIQEKTGIRF